MLHNQIWISLSRYWTAKGKNSIVDKSIEFEQVDRESSWDDQILFNGALFYLASKTLTQAENLPLWRTDGVIMTFLLHSGPVEFLYYWLHRALHHHYLYSRYHSHHHSSIATEPITSVIHPFAEHIAYFALFSIPMLTAILTNTASIASIASYLTYIDFMNNMGHCNHELIPKWLFSIFPPLKYLMYTPSFHSLHHTQFRTNYSLFMPLYDYIYSTVDKCTDELYEISLRREAELPDVVHLTHLTTPESIYHLRLGFASLASKPYTSKWYFSLIWPVTLWSMMLNWLYGRTFIVERYRFNKLRLQSWVIPKYRIQYFLQWQNETINNLIEEAILEAEERGAKVLSLGLLNQVLTIREDEFLKLNKSFNTNSESNLIFSGSYSQKIWLVGDGLDEEEQLKTPKGTLFIPFSQFPPKKLRKDCYYHSPPAMVTPRSLENMHSCENWFPRRVMNAWRIAGIVHALEGWNEHECGNTMSNIEKVWQASLQHGFQPLLLPTESKC
ncbi:protein eceriferum 1 [Quercus suber]|uniref:Protein eceriferum 1 n=2 Tax=Quercus suber TaxID=58331 RepID=A0AAW0ILY3_QUESU